MVGNDELQVAIEPDGTQLVCHFTELGDMLLGGCRDVDGQHPVGLALAAFTAVLLGVESEAGLCSGAEEVADGGRALDLHTARRVNTRSQAEGAT